MTETAELRKPQTVGLVGAGRMGGAIGRKILESGWAMVVADPVEAARDQMVEHGAVAREDAGAVAAESDVVFLVVVDDDQVKEILTKDGGVLERARPGTTVAICASVKPETCVEMAELGMPKGVHVVDMALVGGERAAEAGSIKLMCGGPEPVLSNCQRVLAAFATDVCVIGPVGSGQVAKTVNNLMLWAAIRMDYEALRLAKAYGVEPGKLRPAMAVGTGANKALEDWGLHRLRWPVKDLQVAKALAEAVDVPVPFVDCLTPLMADLDAEELDRYR